jgi:hypothetical protein
MVSKVIPHIFSIKSYQVSFSLIEHYGDKLVILKVHDRVNMISIDDDVRYLPPQFIKQFILKRIPIVQKWKLFGSLANEMWPIGSENDCRGSITPTQLLEDFESISARVNFMTLSF